ncbi:hypothetical protein JKF63_05800 [Porcisia hertigi]|uniref:Uncharacterized protein n=1 Tax=Porcisia hertigi TaxID=2761500 RepID=A0A836ICS7_9TRYP|nr:hypothetical protein JKF63_05800 [Porcisia hertigi]
MRRVECEGVCREHPQQLPVVLESTHPNRVRFLAVPRDATVADLEAEVRKELKTKRKRVALVIEGCSVSSTTIVGDIFDVCKQTDGFLHVSSAAESAMGAKDLCCFGNTGRLFEDLENNPNLIGSL